MTDEWLNRGILQTIEQCSFPAYWISLNKSVHCHCARQPGQDSNPKCPDCLGTGHKIRIQEIKTVSQNIAAAFRIQGGVKEPAVLPVFFFAKRWPVQIDDLITYGGKVFVMLTSDDKKGDNGSIVFYHCEAAPKKANQAIFLANFNRIVGI